jgi:DNA-directed RNA polymerase specialized sigma24 family protein
VELAAASGVVPPVESVEALWRRSLEGDGEAFGALFDRHRDRVFGHACRLADTRQDAEDVVASAFLELWRRRAEVRLVDGG